MGGYISSLLRWVLLLCVLHIFNSCVLYTLQALLSGTLFLESVAYRDDFSEDRGSHASAEPLLVWYMLVFTVNVPLVSAKNKVTCTMYQLKLSALCNLLEIL